MYLDGKKIAKVLPYYPIVILCGGFFCEFVYYKKFGINISYYLEPSEIILLFSKDLIQYTFFTAVIYLLMFLTSSSKYDTAKADALIDIHLENITDEKFDEKSPVFFLKRLKGYFKVYKMIFFSYLMILICYIVISFFPKNGFTNPFSGVLFITTCTMIIGILKEEFQRKYLVTFKKKLI